MLVVEMLLFEQLEKSQFLSFVILDTLEKGEKSLLLVIMDLGNTFPLLLEELELHLSNSLVLSILDVHVRGNHVLDSLHVWETRSVACLDQLSDSVWISELVSSNIQAKVDEHS